MSLRHIRKYSEFLSLILCRKSFCVFMHIFSWGFFVCSFSFFFFFLGGGCFFVCFICLFVFIEFTLSTIYDVVVSFEYWYSLRHKILWRRIRWVCWFINSASKRLIYRISGSLRALILECGSMLDTSVKVMDRDTGLDFISYQQNNLHFNAILNTVSGWQKNTLICWCYTLYLDSDKFIGDNLKVHRIKMPMLYTNAGTVDRIWIPVLILYSLYCTYLV